MASFCTACGKQISEEFRVCPYCGVAVARESQPELSPVEPTAPPTSPTVGDTKKPWRPRGCLGAILVLFLILFVLGVISSVFDSSSKPGSKKPSGDEIAAYTMSQTFVKRELQSPGTAEFPSLLWEKRDVRVTYDTSTGLYTVRAWVDAENAFGAKIRTNHIAVVQQTGADTWEAKRVELLPR
jgi:hypothetical protein